MKHILGSTSNSNLTQVQDGDSQPNAVDLRLDRVLRNEQRVFEISNDHKKHRGSTEVHTNEDGYFYLEPGHYEVIMENIISVGEHEAGWVITRSSFIRNGCYLTSGLYDSEYYGAMAGALHVTVGPALIKRGTRIGQFLLFDAEMLHPYEGSYGFSKDGQPKLDEQFLYGHQAIKPTKS